MMWGISVRIVAGEVELTAPGWLLKAAATHSVVRYMKQLAAELMRDPDRYGYDPALAYTVLVQTWDRALSPIPSLAFGRDVAGFDAVRLIPDIYYIHSDGFRALHEEATIAPAWQDRRTTLAWRGSVTGSGPYSSADEIPRIQLARSARAIPDTDVALFDVHPTMASVFPPEEIEAVITEHALRGDRWPLERFGRYRYVLDIDGHANAWGLLEKLILGCCVLKVQSPFEQWYYDRLVAGVHYVPVRPDLSDLAEVVAWCRANEDRCAWIAHNGALLARSLDSRYQLARSCEALLAVAHLDGAGTPNLAQAVRTSINTQDPRSRLEEAHRAEGAGDSRRAIEAYEAYADASRDQGGIVEALVRKCGLHRELGQIAPAIAALARAEDVAPRDAMLKLQLGQIASSIGRDIAAVDHLRKALLIAPEFYELRINLTEFASRLGWLDLAYWTVRPMTGDLPDWWARARHTANSRYSAARSQVMELLRSRRTRVLDHGLSWALAVGLFDVGRLDVAARLCQRVIDSTPDVIPPYDLMSRIIARQSGAAAALAYLDGLGTELRSQPDCITRRIRFLLEEMRFEDILAECDAHLEVANSFDMRFTTAIALAALDRPDMLRAHCQRWMALAPADVLPAGIVAAAHPLYLVDSAAAASPSASVPLVQYWDKPAVPEDVRAVMDGWTVRNREVARAIVSDEEARTILAETLGADVLTTYELCHHAAMKADFFRIAYLYARGGLYVDADETCLRPLGPLLAAAAASDITAVRSGDMLGYLHNYFLGARMGSPVMQWALEDATRAIHAAQDNGEKPSIWHATGPGLITRAVGWFLTRPGCQAAPGAVILLPFQQYRHYARTEGDLAYKRSRSANWQLA